MLFGKCASASVGAVLGLAAIATSASAADMEPVYKAPVVGPSVPLDVHGYFDETIANTRVTPGGLMIYPYRGNLSQVDVGLSIDVYKDPTGFINSVTIFGDVWNEFWSAPPAGTREWQEMDLTLGFTVGFAQNWKL